MSIEEKLEHLNNESKALRLQLMINDIQQYDYYQLLILRNQIENEMEVKKQILDDAKQDAERQLQINQQQIETSKERIKRPRTKVERVGDVLTSKTCK
jgi:hypothetical protein